MDRFTRGDDGIVGIIIIICLYVPFLTPPRQHCEAVMNEQTKDPKGDSCIPRLCSPHHLVPGRP